ncbi:hypothetical protein SprV_0200811200 [Sparganum proliferum]
MGRPRSRPTDLEDSEDRWRGLRGKPHRRRKSQTRNTQISAAPTSQRKHPNAPYVFTVSADIPGADWTCCTPSDQLQHSDCTNRRLSVHLSLSPPTPSTNSDRPPPPNQHFHHHPPPPPSPPPPLPQRPPL